MLIELRKTSSDEADMASVLHVAAQRGLDRFDGISYLTALPSQCASIYVVPAHAATIQEMAARRKLEIIGRTYVNAVRECLDLSEVIAAGERATTAISQIGAAARQHDWTAIQHVVGLAIDDARHRAAAQERGVDDQLQTGFGDLDQILIGLTPGLYILAARPAMGKTMLMLQVAARVALSGPVGVFSLEMSEQQLVGRLLCSQGGVPAAAYRKGQISPDEWDRLAGAADIIGALPIFFDDQPNLTLDRLRRKCRALKAEHPGLKAIFLDYLQLMEAPQGDYRKRDQVVSEISRGLKLLSKEMQIPILALSQLNRDVEGRTDKRPMCSDLRESGAIEQDADVIMFIYRDEVYHEDSPDRGLAEVIVAKNRAGSTGAAKLGWNGRMLRFSSREVLF
jgi:replicative DNA helicase